MSAHLLIHVRPGDPRYDTIAGALGSEPLAGQWWRDAESRVDDVTSYLMVLAGDGTGRLVPAAWAGYVVEDVGGIRTVRCCNNYVRRGFRGRRPDLYELAYRERHEILIELGLPAVTYLFPEPIPLHEADGWVRDTSPGGSGISTVTGVLYRWQRLTWTP